MTDVCQKLVEQNKVCLELITRLLRKFLISGVESALPNTTNTTSPSIPRARGGHGAGEVFPEAGRAGGKFLPEVRKNVSGPEQATSLPSTAKIPFDRFSRKSPAPVINEQKNENQERKETEPTTETQTELKPPQTQQRRFSDAASNRPRASSNSKLPTESLENISQISDGFFFGVQDEAREEQGSDYDVLKEVDSPTLATKNSQTETQQQSEGEEFQTLYLPSPVSSSLPTSRRSSLSSSPSSLSSSSYEDGTCEGKHIMFPPIFAATFSGDGTLVVVSNISAEAKKNRAYRKE